MQGEDVQTVSMIETVRTLIIHPGIELESLAACGASAPFDFSEQHGTDAFGPACRVGHQIVEECDPTPARCHDSVQCRADAPIRALVGNEHSQTLLATFS